MGHDFPKTARVRHRREYLAAQGRGRKLHTPHFVILLLDRKDGAPARLGIVTSRKVASAVGRNRVRRLVREVFRTTRGRFPSGHDVVVIARSGAAELSLQGVGDELLGAVARRGGARPSHEGSRGGRIP